MIAEFRLPDLGEGLAEAEIVQWLVSAGDVVALNQTIAEVETAKAIVELPSPFEGKVSELRHAAGDTVAVGELLITFDVTSGESAPHSSPEGAGAPATASAPEADSAPESASAHGSDRAVPNLVGYGAAPRSTSRPQRRARIGARVGARQEPAPTALIDADTSRAAPHDAASASSADDDRAWRPRSTPPVRKLAKDLGIDLALVEASGATGVITRADLEMYAEVVGATATRKGAPAQRRDPMMQTPGVRETRLPIRGVRKATAAAMVRSAFTAPHVTTFLTVDVTRTMELVDALRADARLKAHRIGVLAVVAKAVCLALPRHPELNSRWDDEAGEIVQYHYVNLGIAAATERGLIVPHIKDADTLDLATLSDALGDLTSIAREGRSALDQLNGGTFSITNFGVFGVDAGTPILNPGEAGILGVGTVRRQPWEHQGAVALRDVLTLSLSFDHRLADGEQGSKFLRTVADILRDPGRAMLLR